MDKTINNLERKHKIIAAILIGSAVVMFWRGMWGLLDLYLFPDNPAISYITSLIVGFVILIITHKLYKELV